MHSSHLERAWEQTALIEGDLVGDVARATHISVWVGTPFWEPETVDIGIGFPLTSQRLCDAVRSSCSFTPDYAESVIPTTPQLSDLFGSCIAIPAWAPAAGRYAFVLDCQGVGGTVYVVYMRLALTRAALLRHVPEEDQTDVVCYCFGELTELQGQRTAPIQGGVIKVLYESADCLWAGPLEPRLLNPATWNPRVCHPSLIDGNFVVYQSPEDQLVYEDFMPDEDNRVVVAEQVMGYAPGQCWINSPTRPVEHLAHAGRHIRTQFAVNPGPRTTQRDDSALVVLYDLRGLCMFPQWLQLPGELFDYQDYLDDLQLPVIPGWTVVIEGGEATSRRTVLRVKDGDTLVFYLKESSELMATEEEQTSPAVSDDEDNDTDSADDVNQMPNSSDFSSATPPGPGDPPRGPPPPSPVNRSRSPRRRVDIDTTLEAEPSGIKQIELFSLLPSAGFDIQKERLALPHIGQEFHALFEPWPLQWMCLEIGELDLHSSTIRALRALPHWSSFLESAPPKAQFTAHLYTDGSYFSDLAISGLGVVILLQCLDQSCLLGAVTGAVLGGDAELWSQNDPAPAMQAEQAAIIAALLWLGQGLRIFPITSAVVHFDCQAVGWGTNGLWAAATPLTEKAHELELLLRRFLRAGLEFNYIKAHEGQAWNELADVLAKAGAKQTKGLPAVPHATWRAFFAADLRWAATVYHGWTKGTLPIQPSQEFVWQPDQWVCGGSLRPDELLPTTTTTGADADKDTTFAAKILSVNVQGLKGMHRYLEEQCEQRGTQILCIQEHKDVAGLVQSKRYLRLASSSNKHWGTALWFSRTDGAFTIDGKPVCLQETDLQILQDHPRLLSVGATHRGLKFLFFSGHCPHAEKVEERASFLASLQDLQQQMQEADFVAGGLDLNGHHGVTGSLLCGEPDQVGAQIVTLLQRLGLWLPATYPTLHCGPSETYTHPSGRRHRIDFIAIGGRGRIYQARSAVASDFDTGGKGEDHQAVELHVGGCLRPTGLHGRLRQPLYDRESMLAPRGRQLIQQALRNYQVPAWEMHVDQHYAHFQRYFTDFLENAFVLVKGPRASYIPAVVWQWRKAKLALRETTAYRRKGWVQLLRTAFSCWAEGGSSDVAHLFKKHSLLYQVVAAAIGIVTERIKKEIYRGKNKFLHSVAAEGAQNISQILRRLKRNGVGGRKAKITNRPLPALLGPDEKPVGSRREHDDLWLQHWARQEFGEVRPTIDFLESVGQASAEGTEWSLDGLPSLIEIEQHIRQTPKGKAMGLDAIPPEAVLACPSEFAATLQPLLIKSILGARQPLQWKGGVLYSAWKQSGPVSSPDSYRSLFVSSVVGKLYRKMLRSKTADQPAPAPSREPEASSDWLCGLIPPESLQGGKPPQAPHGGVVPRHTVGILQGSTRACGWPDWHRRVCGEDYATLQA